MKTSTETVASPFDMQNGTLDDYVVGESVGTLPALYTGNASGGLTLSGFRITSACLPTVGT